MIPDPYPVPPFRRPLQGSIALPGSKSLSNRALILAALAEGETTLEGLLFSRDTELMLAALETLGIQTKVDREARTVRVSGGGGTLPVGEASLFVGNAGTAARFLTAFLCLHSAGTFHLSGDEAMHARPMGGLIDSLEALGARFTFDGEPGHFPFTLHTSGLQGGSVEVSASASSQFVSALLMAAPFATAPLTVRAPGVRPAFVQITVEMMRAFGVTVEQPEADTYTVTPGTYRAPDGRYPIEPDATAASYFLALPFVTGGSVFLPSLPAQMIQGDTAFAELMVEMGATLDRQPDGWRLAAPTTPVSGVSRNFATFSDTFLTLAAIAPLLDSPTHIEGIAHTRAQETDRVAAMATELRKLGIRVDETEGSLTIHPDPAALQEAAQRGITIDTYEDHRVAMSFALLGSADLRGDGAPWLSLNDPLCCRKTFPDYFEKLAALHTASHR